MTGPKNTALVVLQALRECHGDDDTMYWLLTAAIDRNIGAGPETIVKDVDYAMRALKRESKHVEAQ